MSNTEEMTPSELCRDDVQRMFAERYPKRLQRREVIAAGFGWSCDWSDTQLDQALHVLKKRCIIAQDSEGYQLRTAPESYNARLVAERNAGATPVAEPPPPPKADPNGFTGKCACCGKKVPQDDGKRLDPELCEFCETMCDGCGQAPNECVCKPFPDELTQLDPVAVRTALGELQERLTAPRVDIDDRELKLEVLDYLGRILDDSIEAVLKAIADDIR